MEVSKYVLLIFSFFWISSSRAANQIDFLDSIRDWWKKESELRSIKCPNSPPYSEELLPSTESSPGPTLRTAKCLEAFEGKPGPGFSITSFHLKGAGIEVDEQSGLVNGLGKIEVVRDLKKFNANLKKNGENATCLIVRKSLGRDIESMFGLFVNGRPIENIKVTFTNGDTLIAQFQNGHIHGKFRYWNKDGHLEESGYSYNGRRKGNCWHSIGGQRYISYGKCKGLLTFGQFQEDDRIIIDLFDKIETPIISAKVTPVSMGLNVDNFYSDALPAKVTKVSQDSCNFMHLEWAKIIEKGCTKYQNPFGISFDGDEDMKFYFDIENEKESENICKLEGQTVDTFKKFLNADRSKTDLFQRTIKSSRKISKTHSEESKSNVQFISHLIHLEDRVFSCKFFDDEVTYQLSLVEGHMDYFSKPRGLVQMNFNGPDLPTFPILKKKVIQIVGRITESSNFSGLTLVRLEDEREILLIIDPETNTVSGPAIIIGIAPLFPLNPKYYSGASPEMTVQGFGGIITFNEEGRITDPVYFKLSGDGVLYGNVSSSGDGRVISLSFTDNQAAFIYPDGETAYFGKFKNFEMISGRIAKVKDSFGVCNRKGGIPSISFEIVPETSSLVFGYTPPSNESFGSGPKVPDPFESRTVELGRSSIPNSGDGLFVTRDVPAYTLVSYYHAFMYRSKDEILTFTERYPNNVSLSDEERRASVKYSVNNQLTDAVFAIPPELDDAEAVWVGTLGHKINSDFKGRYQNCLYTFAEHPRFGIINAAITTKALKKGQEIFADYGYQEDNFPNDFPWYHQAKAKFIEELTAKGLSYDKILAEEEFKVKHRIP